MENENGISLFVTKVDNFVILDSIYSNPFV